jgi:hypothetical protein
MNPTIRFLMSQLSADKILGGVGGGLAVASMGFGVYMNIHGPVASFGHSNDFPAFAQMATLRAGREASPMPAQQAPVVATMPSASPDESLDMTETASIPKPSRSLTAPAKIETRIISSVTLESASVNAATIFVDGSLRTVHVGDTVPDAGEVLEIWTGSRPAIKTSRGLIVSPR